MSAITSEWVNSWIISEQATQDTITVKKIYIDINEGNLTDGILFSQIMYWHLPNKRGDSRLQVLKDNEFWLAKTYSDWFEECRVNEHTARKAMKRLEDRGLIITNTWKFNGSPTKHIRINWSEFENRVKSICHNVSDGSDQNGQNEVTKKVRTLTETTTETTTKKKPSDTNVSSQPQKQTPPQADESKPDSPPPAPVADKFDYNDAVHKVRQTFSAFGQENHIINMLRGRSKTGQWAEHNLPEEFQITKPQDITDFRHWYTNTYPDISVPKKPEKIHQFWSEWKFHEAEKERRKQDAMHPDELKLYLEGRLDEVLNTPIPPEESFMEQEGYKMLEDAFRRKSS